MDSTSPKFAVNWTDWYKALRGALVVAASAFVLTGLDQVQSLFQNGTLQLGQAEMLRPMLLAGLSAIVEMARRYLTDYSK